MERLGAQDFSFLEFEHLHTPMNIGGVLVVEPSGPEPRVDVARVRAHVESRLDRIPRYRQRLVRAPLTGHPFWVEDPRFDIRAHVHHVALPRPGTEEQLKELSARLFAQPLDRRRPLWELWVVEGLRDGGYALLAKVHHAMVDGSERRGSGLGAPRPRARRGSFGKLLVGPPAKSGGGPLAFARGRRTLETPPGARPRARALVSLPREPGKLFREIALGVGTTAEMLGRIVLSPAPPTPLNGDVGPDRRFEWWAVPLQDVRLVKDRLGGTVNDVALATVAGAVRRFFRRKRWPVSGRDFRALVPVNLRTPAERIVGNRVSAWLTSLPLDVRDPRERYDRVRQLTALLKAKGEAHGVELASGMGEWADSLLDLWVRLASVRPPYNLIVTNVPGPTFPLYFLGDPIRSAYPVVPLFEKQGLGIALFTYHRELFWGFHVDAGVVEDYPEFVAAVRDSFDELRALAVRAGRKPPRRSATPVTEKRARLSGA
ncbi:MAG: diacylglycerol O-acyltransferase [Candidatus Binatia bacterium]|nr:MAG: diacylglycerol O-acyltransferase [Candidatus Binatia bacterium]